MVVFKLTLFIWRLLDQPLKPERDASRLSGDEALAVVSASTMTMRPKHRFGKNYIRIRTIMSQFNFHNLLKLQ